MVRPEPYLTARSCTFAVHSCLGRGGFGEVYQATMMPPGGPSTEVALKVLRRDVAANAQALERLRDEARSLARLHHPAILKVYRLVHLDGRPTLVSELVEGADLSACMADMSPRALLEVISIVAAALHEALTADALVHRDVKPPNIRLGPRGIVKLLDFGIARTDALTREAQTETDAIIGSPPYLAPERFLDSQARSASDVFALGVTLFEGLFGERMFDVSISVQASYAVDAGRYDAFIAQRLDALSPEPRVRGFIEAMVAYDPAARPTVREVAIRGDGLSEELGGDTLRRWAKARSWRPPPPRAGELTGRTLPEDGPGSRIADLPTAPYTRPPLPNPLTKPPSTSWTGFLLGGMTFAAASGVAALGIAVVAALVWRSSLPGPQTQRPAPDPVLVVVPPPVPDPVPAPEPVAPSPAPKPASPRPAPLPEPVAPRPTPAPQAATSVYVDSVGDSVAVLARGTERVTLPATVAVGRWAVLAAFGGGSPVDAGRSLDLRIGDRRTVRCSSKMRLCDVEDRTP